MADIIKTIGTSGADYTTIQQWWAARTGGAGDRYIGEIITTGSVSSGSGMSGTGNVDAYVIRAVSGLAWNPINPTAPHATLPGVSILTTTPVFYEGLEINSAGTTLPVINTSTTVAKTTVRKCWLRGGRYSVANSVAGSTLLVENCLLQGSARIAVYNFVAGATIRNTVIANCSTEAGTSSSYGGVRKDVAGTILDNVVCYNNGNVDFFGATTTATVSYLASEDATATGSNAVTGVTSAAFTDYSNNIFTAAASGVLDGTGPSGNDRGLVISGAPIITITSPLQWKMFARNPVTNTGSISITGTYSDIVPTSVEARWNGGSWVTLDDAPTGGSYSGTLSDLAADNGTIEVRVSNSTSTTASVDNIAIGAKFLPWGQSNFSGRATNPQPYTGPIGWFHKYTVTNNQWQAGADPFDSATVSGSLFPLLASQLTAALGCPVGFIGVAMGSTALSAWQPGQSLNNRMVDYYNAAGADGIEGVISWIGESDALAATTEVDFKNRYNTVIDQLKTLTGADSLLVAPSGENTTNYANVRQWISDIAATSANTAPNEVQMWPLFQKIHYETNTETELAADAVYNGMLAAFYDAGTEVNQHQSTGGTATQAATSTADTTASNRQQKAAAGSVDQSATAIADTSPLNGQHRATSGSASQSARATATKSALNSQHRQTGGTAAQAATGTADTTASNSQHRQSAGQVQSVAGFIADTSWVNTVDLGNIQHRGTSGSSTQASSASATATAINGQNRQSAGRATAACTATASTSRVNTILQKAVYVRRIGSKSITKKIFHTASRHKIELKTQSGGGYMQELNFKQGASALLQIEHTIDGEPVSGISEAKYELYSRTGQVLVTKSMGEGIEFSAGLIEIQLTEDDTADLIQSYNHQCVAKDLAGLTFFPLNGQITFGATKPRL